MNDMNDKNDKRFEELISQLLDQELTPDELSQLVELVKDNPDRQQELQDQLETAELLAQSEDDLRSSSLFIAAVQSQMGDDPFVTSVRSAITSGQTDARSTAHMKRQRLMEPPSTRSARPWFQTSGCTRSQ